MNRLPRLALTLALGAAPLVAAAPTPAQAAGEGFEQLREQGKLYYKRKLFKQAMSTLDAAARTPEGQKDFETALYRARVAYELLLLETAFEALDAALARAATDRERQDADELRREMNALFGAVTIVPDEVGETNTRGRIFFDSKTGIINKDKKQRFEAIRDRFRSTDVQLPRTVYLPYGEYTANNVPFSIVQGEQPPKVSIFLQVQKEEDDDDGALWWYVGGAVLVGAGVTTAILLATDDEPASGPLVLETIKLRIDP